MSTFTDYVPCPRGTAGQVCNARISQASLADHLAWHDNLKASMTGAAPLLSVSLLNGL